MEITIGVWLGLILGGLPLLGWLLWWWNEFWYVIPLRLRYSWSGIDTKLPPGHMGFPIIGEMLTFLWYFKILRRPDEFINSKRRKYGDGVGLYRTHMFGSPSIIACFPSTNKFVLQTEDIFIQQWPNVDLVGNKSLVAVHGKAHARLRSYVINAINRPNSLQHIAALVQPRLAAALQSWVQKGRIKAYDEIKRLTFENVGIFFASIEPSPQLDGIEKLFHGIVKGIRAQPLNIPGTAAYHGFQCRKKLDAIFHDVLKKKRNRLNVTDDLMDGLIEMKDEEGNKLSDQEVVDNIVSLIIGGYESTSLASMWAIYYIAKFPNVLKKLREENISLKQEKQGDHFITSADVSKLEYTNKVVEETIRMANISAFVFRLVTKEVEYKGYKIPKNWKIIIWLRYLHTNPENFEDPMCFNPDRWNKPARPATYQVFGAGSRICAGNMLARLQVALLIHHLSIGYRWELLNPDAEMTYLPNPKPVDNVEVAFNAI